MSSKVLRLSTIVRSTAFTSVPTHHALLLFSGQSVCRACGLVAKLTFISTDSEVRTFADGDSDLARVDRGTSAQRLLGWLFVCYFFMVVLCVFLLVVVLLFILFIKELSV